MPVIPKVTITSQSTKKISDESGKSRCVCSFVVDGDVFRWESRAVKGDFEPGVGVGEIVESGGELKSGQSAEVIVDDEELSSGDGLYTISIYAQNIYGYWSDGTFMQTYVGVKYNSAVKYNTGRKYNCKV